MAAGITPPLPSPPRTPPPQTPQPSQGDPGTPAPSPSKPHGLPQTQGAPPAPSSLQPHGIPSLTGSLKPLGSPPVPFSPSPTGSLHPFLPPAPPLPSRLSVADSNFVLGNAQVPSAFPVVYCSDGFCDLTGFSRAEVMQRCCACSFLYGPDTSELLRQQLRRALDEHQAFKGELILYRKSGGW